MGATQLQLVEVDTTELQPERETFEFDFTSMPLGRAVGGEGWGLIRQCPKCDRNAAPKFTEERTRYVHVMNEGRVAGWDSCVVQRTGWMR